MVMQKILRSLSIPVGHRTAGLQLKRRRRMRRPIMFLGFLLTLMMAGSLFAQRADRGIITGVVTDPSGAAVPGAKAM